MDDAKKNLLENLTKITVSQLEQIIFITVAIWHCREDVCLKAKQISKNANEIKLPYNKGIALSTLATISETNPELFEVDGIGKEKGFGHFSNKMIIVSIVAAIEGYLSECAEILGIGTIPNSFKALITKINEEKNIDLQTINECQEALLISYIRHKIVHTLGKVDNKFKNEQLPSVTGEEADFLKSKDINIGDQIEIPIDQLILPCISKSISFIKQSNTMLQNGIP